MGSLEVNCRDVACLGVHFLGVNFCLTTGRGLVTARGLVTGCGLLSLGDLLIGLELSNNNTPGVGIKTKDSDALFTAPCSSSTFLILT